MHNVKENNESLGLLHYLLRDKLISHHTFKMASEEIKETQINCVTYLVKNNILSSDDLINYCSKQFKLPVIQLTSITKEHLQHNMINSEFICRHRIIPFLQDQHSLHLATADPTNITAINAFSFHADCSVKLVLMSEIEIEECLSTYFHTGMLNKCVENASAKIPLINESPADPYQHEEPVTLLVDQLLEDAIAKTISDIHIEPCTENFRIRFRRDGILYEAATLPAYLAERVIARLKIMAKMDITEHRLPQDGHIQLASNNIDIRVNTCPLLHGEKLVLRLLNIHHINFDIDKLGLSSYQIDLLLRYLKKPQGLILVTGPTGSGKTLTLYAALNYLNTIEKNICTVEDPVEIEVKGINQIAVNTKIKLNFAETLRALLRQDPDIIMIGEIRDHETASIAAQAAQTGHLVLSTLHTNSAIDALIRLQTLNVSIDDMANSLSLVIAQRLVRKLCENCKIINANGIYEAQGCEKCHQGYQGRIGIFELLVITPEFIHEFLRNPHSIMINQPTNHLNLQESAQQKITAGLTTSAEILRVLG